MKDVKLGWLNRPLDAICSRLVWCEGRGSSEIVTYREFIWKWVFGTLTLRRVGDGGGLKGIVPSELSVSAAECASSRPLWSELHPWVWAELRVFPHATSTRLVQLLLKNIWSALFKRERHKTQKIHHGFKIKTVTVQVRIFKAQSIFTLGSKTSLKHLGTKPVPPHFASGAFLPHPSASWGAAESGNGGPTEDCHFSHFHLRDSGWERNGQCSRHF